MNKLFFASLLIISCLTSCKKEETNQPDNNTSQQSTTNFMPLSVGNYWVYDWYKVDSNGVESYYNERDSLYISKDTIINGNTYYKQEGTFSGMYETAQFLRDSNDYLVNSDGEILFSATNFTDILNTDTFEYYCYIDYQMAHKDSLVTVPAGTFTTYNCMGTIYNLDSAYQAQWGTQYMHNIYADSIGLVLEQTHYYNMPYNKLQKRLVKYYLQ